LFLIQNSKDKLPVGIVHMSCGVAHLDRAAKA